MREKMFEIPWLSRTALEYEQSRVASPICKGEGPNWSRSKVCLGTAIKSTLTYLSEVRVEYTSHSSIDLPQDGIQYGPREEEDPSKQVHYNHWVTADFETHVNHEISQVSHCPIRPRILNFNKIYGKITVNALTLLRRSYVIDQQIKGFLTWSIRTSLSSSVSLCDSTSISSSTLNVTFFFIWIGDW